MTLPYDSRVKQTRCTVYYHYSLLDSVIYGPHYGDFPLLVTDEQRCPLLDILASPLHNESLVASWQLGSEALARGCAIVHGYGGLVRWSYNILPVTADGKSHGSNQVTNLRVRVGRQSPDTFIAGGSVTVAGLERVDPQAGVS